MINAIIVDSEKGDGRELKAVKVMVCHDGIDVDFRMERHNGPTFTPDQVWIYHNDDQYGAMDIGKQCIVNGDSAVVHVRSAFKNNPIKRIN